MTREEFEHYIEHSDDIQLRVNGTDFTIMTCYENIVIGIANSGKDKEYETVDELLEKFIINGDPLIEQLSDVEYVDCAGIW